MPKSGEKRRPRRGSMGFWPRKRASRIYPRIKRWPDVKENIPLGFAGYKVGMTHLFIKDTRKTSPTRGEEVFTPVTIIEVPPIKVFGIRLYKKTPYGLKAIYEIWDGADQRIKRRIKGYKEGNVEEQLKKLEEKTPEVSDIKLVVHTQPWLAGIGKKTPEVFEIAIGGSNIEEKINKATELLGKEIKVSDVFKEGEQIDVIAVTKGKGFQGEVKRFGVKLLSHKSEKKIRKAATRGPWHPHRILPTVPMPGQMGFHRRTEYNKWIVKISENPEEINPSSGWPHYGIIKSSWIAVKGSVPGSTKRLIALRKAIRPNPKISQEVQITYISRAPKN